MADKASPQQQKLTALERALGAQRQAQQDARQKAQELKSPSTPTK